jgi:hypothetical protein
MFHILNTMINGITLFMRGNHHNVISLPMHGKPSKALVCCHGIQSKQDLSEIKGIQKKEMKRQSG